MTSTVFFFFVSHILPTTNIELKCLIIKKKPYRIEILNCFIIVYIEIEREKPYYLKKEIFQLWFFPFIFNNFSEIQFEWRQ